MAKRNRKLDYEKMIKEGLGSGNGKDYKPWLKILLIMLLMLENNFHF